MTCQKCGPESPFLADVRLLQSHSGRGRGVDGSLSEGCTSFLAAHTETLLFRWPQPDVCRVHVDISAVV